MIRIMILVLTVVCFCIPVYADGEKASNGDFVSNTLTDVFDKLSKITSGEKSVFYSEDEPEQVSDGYSADVLGERMPQATRTQKKSYSSDE